jgi:hypothetical protein
MRDEYHDWRVEMEACNELGRELAGNVGVGEAEGLMRIEFAIAIRERPEYRALLLTQPFFSGGIF